LKFYHTFIKSRFKVKSKNATWAGTHLNKLFYLRMTEATIYLLITQ